MKEGIVMLKNIKENKNIVIPIAPHNDSAQIQASGVLAWSFWAVVGNGYKNTSTLKNMVTSFSLIEAPNA
ncbi:MULTISPECIES: hypothetical protein [Streptococcus]|jgi:hypothetical protein|nr:MULTISPECIES: hypothetical protein [Streptococcus]MCB4996014.1 hypothetical protein [Streptococcus mutans]MCB5035790.1 hypothetical protein [Streptococcus mutans]MCB5098876.1 hypothetical protein [Streptococcus mutans]MDT9501968.1 hypothetical protein [Streptococcus mutans]